MRGRSLYQIITFVVTRATSHSGKRSKNCVHKISRVQVNERRYTSDVPRMFKETNANARKCSSLLSYCAFLQIATREQATGGIFSREKPFDSLTLPARCRLKSADNVDHNPGFQ